MAVIIRPKRGVLMQIPYRSVGPVWRDMAVT
jgi:hypothetical protein